MTSNDNPKPLSPKDIAALQADLDAASAALASAKATTNPDTAKALTRAAMADITKYYASQPDRGYAGDATQVVQNTGVFGKVANQEIIDALGQGRYEKIIPQVALQLSEADLADTVKDKGSAPTENEISNYHAAVYKNLGIDQTYWGGSTCASLGFDWSQNTLKPYETDADLSKNDFYAKFDATQTATSYANLMAAGRHAMGNNLDLWSWSSLLPTLKGVGLEIGYPYAFAKKYGTPGTAIPNINIMYEGDTVTRNFRSVQAAKPVTQDPTTLHNLGNLSTAVRQAMATAAADPTGNALTGSVTTATLSDGRNYIGADAIQKALWSGWTVTTTGSMKDAAGASYQVTPYSTATLQQLACLDGEYAQLVKAKPVLAGELGESSFFALMQNPSFAYLTLADGSVAANGSYMQDPKTGQITSHGNASPYMFEDTKLGLASPAMYIPYHWTLQWMDGSTSKTDSIASYSLSAGSVTFGMLQAIDPSAGTVKAQVSMSMLSGNRHGAVDADPTVVKQDQGMDAVILSLTTPNAGQVTRAASDPNAGKFDIANDGTRTPIGWVGPSQALLVYDPYGTPVVNSTDVVRSVADLARYDANKDGTLSAAEADKAGVRLWFPSNGTVAPETFSQAGVQSIAIAGTDDVSIDNGNALLGLHRVAAAGYSTASASDAYLATPTSTGTPLYYANGKAGTQQVAGAPMQEFIEQAGTYSRFANSECVYDDAGGSKFNSQGVWQVNFTLGKGSTLELGNDTGDRVRLNDIGDTVKLDLVKDASGIGLRQSGNDVVIYETASHCSVTLAGLMGDAAAGWDPKGIVSFADGSSMTTGGIVAQLQRLAAAGARVASAAVGTRTTTAATLAAPVATDMSALAAAIGWHGGADASSPYQPAAAPSQASLAKAHADA